MAYMFTTASGSRYIVSDGQLHQVYRPSAGSDPIPSSRIRRVIVRPQVGARASFELRAERRDGQWVTTNVVESVREIPASWVPCILGYLDHEDADLLAFEAEPEVNENLRRVAIERRLARGEAVVA